MKRTSLHILAAALATAFACTGAPIDTEDPADPAPEQEEEEEIVDDPYVQAKMSAKTVSQPGETVSFTVDCNFRWTYTLSEACMTEVEKTDSTLVLALSDLDYTRDRSVTVKFGSEKYPDTSKSLKFTARCALAMDITGTAAGRAEDKGPFGVEVTTADNPSLSFVWNPQAAVYATRYSKEPGWSAGEGYVYAEWKAQERLRLALEYGHSLEAWFITAATAKNTEQHIISTIYSKSGAGIYISKNGNVAYKVCTGGTWHIIESSVKAEAGSCHHAIGIWNAVEGTATLYVDGQIAGSTDASGDLTTTSAASGQLLCVGGAPSGTGAGSGFSGDILAARIYNAAIPDTKVAELWAAADCGVQPPASVSGIVCIPECCVIPGNRYPIYADGMDSATDRIRLRKGGPDGDICPEPAFAFENSSRVAVTLPADISSGTWAFSLMRGETEIPLATAVFDVQADGPGLHRPGNVAHRGYHTGNAENSIEALAKAQELGCDLSELDLWITTDDVVYVNHDGVIGGCTIQKSTSADLAKIKLGNGEFLPTFEQYLAQALKDTTTHLLIEIKEHTSQDQENRCTDKAMQMVTDAGLDACSEWISFSKTACTRIHGARPEATVGYLGGGLTPQACLDLGARNLAYSYETLQAHPDYIPQAHALGMTVGTWTVEETSLMKTMIGMGCDNITTDHPDRLKAVLDKLFD